VAKANQLFSAQSREFCSDPNRQPSLTAFSVPLLPKPHALALRDSYAKQIAYAITREIGPIP
jgi:hypothetical protein